MRFSLAALILCLATPAVAEMTHNYGGRLGVAYVSDPTRPNGQTRALYEGYYATTVTHETDGGLRFRFEFDIIVGNINDPRPLRSRENFAQNRPRERN